MAVHHTHVELRHPRLCRIVELGLWGLLYWLLCIEIWWWRGFLSLRNVVHLHIFHCVVGPVEAAVIARDVGLGMLV